MPLYEMTDNDFLKLRARNRALAKIINQTRFGEVEGISFDFRHKEIDPEEWTMDFLGGTKGYAPRRINTLPFIWFPWHGKFDPEQLKAEVTKECEALNEFNARPLSREPFGNITDDEYRKHLREHKN